VRQQGSEVRGSSPGVDGGVRIDAADNLRAHSKWGVEEEKKQ
jgi:hypothetical protein